MLKLITDLKKLFVLCLALTISAPLVAQNHSWLENYGQVKRLYPDPDRTWFQLENGKTAMNPKSGYYYIPTSHKNYRTMIDLLHLATEHRWKISVRTKETPDAGGYAEVIYLVVDH